MVNAKNSVRIDDETYQLLKNHKENTGVSMAFAIKTAVAKYLSEYPSNNK